MISDPKTTPESRAGRILFALLVAAGAGFVQFQLFRTNALLWSLAAISPLVPILNRILPGPVFSWQRKRHLIVFPKFPLPQPKGISYESAVR